MSLNPTDFDAFFHELNGFRPFPWQLRLLDTILETGRWPEVIGAPTGAGKSHVVDIHVFANALFGAGSGPRVPRRLSVVVGRRALVDSQSDRAARLQQALQAPQQGSVMQAVSGALASFSGGKPLVLGHLRGGLSIESGWIDDPRTCAVISATPDMWGSRLLFRGYGSSRQARPREAGLLAFDSVMVLDEAHLNRQLLLTARRVAELSNRHPSRPDVPVLQVVETTATPAGQGTAQAIGVDQDDLANPALHRRVMLPKPLTLHESKGWSNKAPSQKYVAELAGLVRGHHASAPGGTIGCIVNRVETALRVAEALRDLEPVCWVGPMRPHDLNMMHGRHPVLFGKEEGSHGDIPTVLVATQTAEVGVDIDLVALVTELAPGPALAQRAGRVNRRGTREAGPVTVVVPSGSITDHGPYLAKDLTRGLQWLRNLPEEGITPWAVLGSPPPLQSRQRLLYKRPEIADVTRWECSSQPAFEEEHLELWLRDSLEPDDLPGGLVLRAHLPVDDTLALGLLRQTLPDANETYPVRLFLLRQVVERVLAGRTSARGFIFREGELHMLAGLEDADSLRPGDVCILDSVHHVTRWGVVVVDPGDEQPQTMWGHGRDVILPGHPRDWLLRSIPEGLDVVGAQELSTDPGAVRAEMAQSIYTRLTEQQDQIALPPVADDDNTGAPLPWLVVSPPVDLTEVEEVRQEWSPAAAPVLLTTHQIAVAGRAAEYAAGVGLSPHHADVLREAGLHHDEGKADARFQRERLGAQRGEVLAKGRNRNAQQSARNRARSSLPRGWRHELRSVAEVLVLIEDCNELVLRLVGTSHGHGRGGIPGSAGDLVTESDGVDLRRATEVLFEEGEWYSVMDRTAREVGAWGCAYLEAILRAADCQVSKEGS